jgi:hypothetical protein
VAVNVSPDTVAAAEGSILMEASTGLSERQQVMLDLMERAEHATATMGADNPNRKLIVDLAVAAVAHYTRVRELETELADKPRIVVP